MYTLLSASEGFNAKSDKLRISIRRSCRSRKGKDKCRIWLRSSTHTRLGQETQTCDRETTDNARAAVWSRGQRFFKTKISIWMAHGRRGRDMLAARKHNENRKIRKCGSELKKPTKGLLLHTALQLPGEWYQESPNSVQIWPSSMRKLNNNNARSSRNNP